MREGKNEKKTPREDNGDGDEDDVPSHISSAPGGEEGEGRPTTKVVKNERERAEWMYTRECIWYTIIYISTAEAVRNIRTWRAPRDVHTCAYIARVYLYPRIYPRNILR